ncbi:MAG: S8 family serine peptidase [Actinomycetota bacterium]|nr:S8 family serine peptidase [Actinomycetota bacterium]
MFARGSGLASSFAIAKALDQAVADGCELINMSLGGGAPDPVLQAAVEDARAAGSVCIIATGNDGQGQVSFPASDDMAIAVGALGRKGTFPADSAAIDDVRPPYGKDEKDFVAAFSNTGPALDLIGPGVGIISTVPGGYAEVSGTSMACPAVTGVAARIVASMGALGEKGDPARSAAISRPFLASARDLGFAPVMEGHGLPEPA